MSIPPISYFFTVNFIIGHKTFVFNILTCYGQGIRFLDRETGEKTMAKDIRAFCLHNAIHLQWLRMATDMKYNYFSVLVINLSRDRYGHADGGKHGPDGGNRGGYRPHALPAEGRRFGATGSVYFAGSDGGYWSSTPSGSGKACFLLIDSTIVLMSEYGRSNGLSVRLVQ